MRKFRTTVLGAALLSLTMIVSACGGSGGDDNGAGGEDKKAEITVGSDNFAESQIVGEMYAQVLEHHGYTAPV